MAVMQQDKGGSSLAQSFMNNTATQARPLPQITAPQGFSTPQPAPMPTPKPMGTMAPQVTEQWTYLGKEIPAERAKQLTYGFGSNAIRQRGQMPTMQRVVTQPQQPQMAPQPSRYQQIAQAINDRAVARLNNGGR